MKKSTIAGIIFGIFTFTILYFILTNKTLVFEMFEGKFEYTDPFSETTVSKTAAVSLSSVVEGKSSLTFYGYFKLLFVLILIPVITGSFVKWRISRKLRKRDQAPSAVHSEETIH